MRSVDSLKRRLDNLQKRLPQSDVEFEVLALDEEPDDDDDVIIIDLVGAYQQIAEEA